MTLKAEPRVSCDSKLSMRYPGHFGSSPHVQLRNESPCTDSGRSLSTAMISTACCATTSAVIRVFTFRMTYCIIAKYSSPFSGSPLKFPGSEAIGRHCLPGATISPASSSESSPVFGNEMRTDRLDGMLASECLLGSG